MKTIHINRHAKSSWSSAALSDHDRPLNKRGKINAKFMSKRFAKEYQVDLIITSSAKRARTTAKRFAKALNISGERFKIMPEVYGASNETLMKIINEVDDGYDRVMIFGHNPDLSNLAAYLDANFSTYIVTCARVMLTFEVDSWQEIIQDSGQLVEYDYPRKYPEMENL